MLAMNDKNENKILLEILNRKQANRPAFWFMRQAGRYLPEYRELRQKAGGFLDLVYNPDHASEVTIQPIRRFGMDAAILFSDILVVPQALGQALRFETGEGPKLDPIRDVQGLKNLDVGKIDDVLNPVYETVKQTREKLLFEGFDETTLIGFAGSPWTVACYMVEGGGSKTFEATKKWAYADRQGFGQLIEILIQSTIHYLSCQIEAGAEAIQLFDSWSGVLDTEHFQSYVVEPTEKIVSALHAKYPDIPVIGFPREAGEKSIHYAKTTGINAIGLDYSIDPVWARDYLQPLMPVQGNLDPVTLLTGGEGLERSANHILEIFGDQPFIFNLGHGIIKETPPEHVAKLSDIIRNFKI